MQTTTVYAPDIECEGCANAIRRAVGGLAGVLEVQVNVTARTVSVRHNAEVARETLVAALERAGFPVCEATPSPES
ncbi:MAG: heavy metal-associated domain-containing protein [Chloroherpetonaceae bacterium]|nr:heavy-metal-associated domain-containing protein [Chthonomonadaceae bacterium]MDW8207785.1 heavy metal-associated domain-containing protein [Chloroherpetonaceae bacterium]